MSDEHRPFPAECHHPETGERERVLVLRKEDHFSDGEILIGSDGRRFRRRLNGSGVEQIAPPLPADERPPRGPNLTQIGSSRTYLDPAGNQYTRDRPA